MPSYLTLQKISQNLLSELLRSRTDFLLHQSAMWQEINDAAKVNTVFVKPDSLDVYHTKFEFFMVQKVPNLFIRIINWFRKTKKLDPRFRICSMDENKRIKVTIAVRLQSDKQLIPEITTEPEIALKPPETYVTGIAV